MRTWMLPLVLLGALLPASATSAPEDGTVEGYVKALKSKDPAVRRQVAVALGELGAKARPAVPALRQALLDADEGVQGAAAAALEKIGGAPAPADRDAALKRLRAECEDLRARLEKVLAQQKAEREKAAQAEVAAAQKLADAVVAQGKAAQVEAEKMRAELRDRAVAAEIASRALKDRNEQLVRQVEELTRELARLRKESPAARPEAGLKPPGEVEGKVKAVDDKSGLLTLTVGSDAGLARGHTLELFRLAPAPKYLGRVKVIEVKPTSAVAQPVGKLREAAQVGDSVASRVEKK